MKLKRSTLKTKSKLFAIAADDWQNDIMSYQKLGTYRENKYVAKKLIDEFGHLDIDQITKQHIQKYASKLTETLSPAVIRRYLGVFKSIMEYASDDWVMPRIKLPKGKKHKQEFYTFEEVRKMFKHSSGQERVLLMLLAETGCRVGEATALRSEDIQDNVMDINKNVIAGIIQDSPKTQNSVRKVVLSQKLCYLIQSIVKTNKLIFQSPTGKPASQQYLGEKFKIICKNAGLPWRGFHAFRRGNITELIVNLQMPEKVVGYRVGHESGGITLGVYCQVREGCDKEWIERIEESLWTSEQ